jgi:hypothetical protein
MGSKQGRSAQTLVTIYPTQIGTLFFSFFGKFLSSIFSEEWDR